MTMLKSALGASDKWHCNSEPSRRGSAEEEAQQVRQQSVLQRTLSQLTFCQQVGLALA